MDNLTPAQRKKNMRNIKSKDTDIELLLRKELWKQGYRYRKNYKKLPGTPDVVLTKYKIAIFCDGEFFHGKDWEELRPRLVKILRGIMKSIKCSCIKDGLSLDSGEMKSKKTSKAV